MKTILIVSLLLNIYFIWLLPFKIKKAKRQCQKQKDKLATQASELAKSCEKK